MYVTHDHLRRTDDIESLLHLPTTNEEQLIHLVSLMEMYPPRTRLKPGTLAELIAHDDFAKQAIQTEIKHRGGCPRVWQVRFVISRWAYDCLSAYASTIEDIANEELDPENIHFIEENFYDHLYHWVEESTGRVAEFPMIYAHGMPHGMYPNSAHWFREASLRRTVIQAPTEDWPVILDAAGAPYRGFEHEQLWAGNLMLDMAPDLYVAGRDEDIFDFEEDAVHTAAGLGLEEKLLKPGRDLKDFNFR